MLSEFATVNIIVYNYEYEFIAINTVEGSVLAQ
jgi:hypothetical protein